MDLLHGAARSGDRVVRIELRQGQVAVSIRDVNAERAPAVVVSPEPHDPYPHKTTAREQFARALASAHRTGADDAILVTADGYVAEGTAWSVFWWVDGTLYTPAEDLGILPGIGRSRVLELTRVQEARVRAPDLAGRSLFLVNAVRGIVEIRTLQAEPVPSDPRTAELSSSFWPD
jgi:branched-subunit amino acid aminotransferase/4-amino-4-deoxychorismate lyase